MIKLRCQILHLSILLFSFIPQFIYSQDIEVILHETYLYGTFGSEIIFDFEVVNISNQEQVVFVVRTINDLPPDWASALCVGQLIYPPDMDSVATAPPFPEPPLQPGDTLDASVHVFTQFHGTAYIQVQIGTFMHPNDRVIVDYIATTIDTFVTVIVPNGGEEWSVGSLHNIEWSRNQVSNINIDYSINNGATWVAIINNYPTSGGNYSWEIPNTPSTDCKVRISDASNLSIFDESDNVFSILQETLSVNSPNGGEVWHTGTVHLITWSSNNISNVKIELTLNNGANWSTIVNSTPSDGVYEWLIPNTPSNQCKVKISDVAHPGIYDESESSFHINPFVFYAVIQADTLWYDTDYDGLELDVVDGSSSHISEGTITDYEWYVNGEHVASGISPTIELITGKNNVKLICYSDSGLTASDSTFISIYAAQLSTNGAVLSGVSQLGNNFYVTSLDNSVYRIDSTGAILQSYLTGGSIQSSLCINNQTSLMYVGSSDTRLYCFDASLNSLWDKGVGGVVSNSSSVNYEGEVVYVGANDINTNLGFLKALDALNGNPKWTFQADGTILSSPLVMEIVDSNNVVIRTIIYFGTSKGTFYSIDDLGSSYSLFWSEVTTPDSGIVSSPAISIEGMLYIGSKNGYLYRFNWDGQHQSEWKKYTGGSIISSPIIDENEIVYIASSSGYIYGFEKDFNSNSNPVKSFYQNVGINGTPGIGLEGSLLLGCDNGKFFALDKNAPGVEMPIEWYFQASGPIVAPTLVTDNGIIYFGCINGDVFIMKVPNSGNDNPLFSDYEWPTFKGNNQRSKVVRLSSGVSSVKNSETFIVNYGLQQNYPNPFNPVTKIIYQIPESGFITLKLYNVLGSEVVSLVNEEKPVGRYEIEFDATSLSSGIYFYRLQAGDFIETKKMVLMK